jgi:hypothetical protein
MSVIILMSCPVIFCQETYTSSNLWFSIGPGFYQEEGFIGVTGYASLNFLQKKSLQTMDGIRNKNLLLKMRAIKNIGSIDEDNYENFSEFGLLIGKSFGKAVQLTFSGGLGTVRGTKPEKYNPQGTPIYGNESFLTLGIPLELGINLAPSKYFGLGVVGFSDINPKCTFSGIALNLLFGKIK